MRHSRRTTCARATMLILSASLIFMAVGAAMGTGSSTAGAAAAATPLHAKLNAVSCSSAAACTAVGFSVTSTGSAVLAERWNGSAWSIETTPDPAGADGARLYGVACPTAKVCDGVGSYALQTAPSVLLPLAERWNGTSWKITAIPPLTGAGGSELMGVSCVSTSFCKAVGYYVDSSINRDRALAATWTAGKWSTELSPIVTAGSILYGVSCISTSWCMAAGAQDYFRTSPGRLLAEAWSGGHWSVTLKLKLTKSLPGGNLNGISCTSTAKCLAVGGEDTGVAGVAEQWSGTAWKMDPLAAASSIEQAWAVSCASGAGCIAVGNGDDSNPTQDPAWAASYSGTSWTPMTTATPGGSLIDTLSGVSCTSASSCEAVGFENSDLRAPADEALAEFWNGTAWSLQSTPDPT
jgi:hypothetical protein